MKIHPITAFFAWLALVTISVAVIGTSTSQRGEGGLVDLVMIVNGIVIVVLVNWDVRRRRRINEATASAPTGLCRSCGYDLRATPQRCPECGTVVGEHVRERDRW